MVVDIWRRNGGEAPTEDDTLVGGQYPALVADDFETVTFDDTTLWDIDIATGDRLIINVVSNDIIKQATLVLTLERQ